MSINFHSTVLITDGLETMKLFYTGVMRQELAFDFGNCIGFACGLSLWQLQAHYPLTKALGDRPDELRNDNVEVASRRTTMTQSLRTSKRLAQCCCTTLRANRGGSIRCGSSTPIATSLSWGRACRAFAEDCTTAAWMQIPLRTVQVYRWMWCALTKQIEYCKAG